MLSEYTLLKKNMNTYTNTKINNIDSDNEVDKAIIEETNMLLAGLEKDIIALSEISLIINENIVIDGEKLNDIEENVIETDTTLSETIPLLKEVIEIKEQINNKYTILAVIGGTIIGGGIGSIGFAFGVVPGVIGLSLGTGGGGGIAYVVDKIKTKFF